MEMIICPIHWTRWRKDFEPASMISLVDSPADLEEIRPPWICKSAHYSDCFLDVEREDLSRAPSRKQIEDLILWLQRHVHKNARFLIHCHAGRGRSPAAGLIAWAILLGPGREQEAFDLMVSSCMQKELLPNALVIKLADDLLGLNGRLLAPLLAWNERAPWSRPHI